MENSGFNIIVFLQIKVDIGSLGLFRVDFIVLFCYYWNYRGGVSVGTLRDEDWWGWGNLSTRG